jgi:hypothetical protein
MKIELMRYLSNTILFFILVTGLCVKSSFASTLYEIKDLKILYSEKSYLEFFEHAKDIKPSQRNELWIKMVNEMAEGLANEIISDKIYNNKKFQTLVLVSSWSSLSQNNYFKSLFHKSFNNSIAFCFKSSPPELCSKRIDSFLSENKPNAETLFELLNLYHKYLPGNLSLQNKTLWSIVDPLIKDKQSEFYCAKKSVIPYLDFKIKFYFNNKKKKKGVFSNCR